MRYLDRLAQEGAHRGVQTVVYLDNASFHRSQALFVCVVSVGWRVGCVSVKLDGGGVALCEGGLMLRRYYADVDLLGAAVVAGLKQLDGEELKI